MNPERAALLYAVRANPDEDTPRLVLADWLEENGEEDRAAFIRYQFDRALHARTKVSGDRHSEWPRDGGKAPFDDWADSATTIFGPYLTQVAFRWRRGFIDWVGLPVGVFTNNADALFALHPVEAVTLADVRPELHPADPGFDGTFDWDADGRRHILVGVDTDVDNNLFGARVPMPIWEVLAGFTDRDDEPDQWPHKTFPTRAHAREALADACVLWGRNLHGLPVWNGRTG